MNDLKYLKQLSLEYPTANLAASEIINLSSLLYLPKGTEHFISDIHGENNSFLHILKNGSGSVRQKIEDELGDEVEEDKKRELASLIYYPQEKLALIKKQVTDFESWCKEMMRLLIRITRRISSKYPRTKFKRALPSEYEYIIEELIIERSEVPDKEAYYNEIISSIINTGKAEEFIIVFSRLIQHLSIDRLHVIGDIYDRGSGAVEVMDRLCTYHSVDIQWGNHDAAWMGAACGSEICITQVLRVSAHYGNFSTLETGYGINLLPLAIFAEKFYGKEDCTAYLSLVEEDKEKLLHARMCKAISIIGWKLEGALALRRPEWNLDGRRLLEKINFIDGTIEIGGKTYLLEDKSFPTVNPSKVYSLTKEEKEVLNGLVFSFKSSEKLQRHIEFLYARGSMYRVYNGNLLYHGCIPLQEDGSFYPVNIQGKEYVGKALCDEVEKWVRKCRYSMDTEELSYAKDFMWYVCTGAGSPLFGKEKMATFEMFLIKDKKIREEKKNAYYRLYEKEEIVKKLFNEFSIPWETGHIINGHVPVKIKDGESPLHCGGKVIIIDGGFAKAYQKVTGIAGYTLIFSSRTLKLVAHEPFISKEKAIIEGKDIHSTTDVLHYEQKRLCIADTDKGKEMQEKINDLKELMQAYKEGSIREHQA